MFIEPELISGSNAYRSTNVTPPRRLEAKRGGYAERTVTTSDGVRLAVRDYGSAGAREHTIVLLHGLCLTQSSWALQMPNL
ncbi:alpha/beta fold hydrolase, partial [Mycobacterium colombiense]|uniref:alpha/beta fold hydrolase n=1 Tax=Mycobacterium colombiense TaxID=339268 RepID=UPI003AF9C42C